MLQPSISAQHELYFKTKNMISNFWLERPFNKVSFWPLVLTTEIVENLCAHVSRKNFIW